MMYKGLDFDADKPAMYKQIREAMAEIYEDDISLFIFFFFYIFSK